MRRRMQAVHGEARTHRVRSVDLAEGFDTRARRRVNQMRQLPDRAQHLAESRDLGTGEGRIRAVRGREVREDPIDLEARERANRSIARGRLVDGRPEAGEAGVDLEVDPRGPPE